MNTIKRNEKYFTERTMSLLLGVPVGKLLSWQLVNKAAGRIMYGPPYEVHERNVVYPAHKFSVWCAQVRKVDGVPNIGLPIF